MPDNHSRLLQMRELLETAFSPRSLQIVDDSWKHAGHAGAAKHGGGHYSVDIVAEAFAGKNRLQCHRLVMQVLRPMFSHDIHALSISARAPTPE